jgi:hypothetical protein
MTVLKEKIHLAAQGGRHMLGPDLSPSMHFLWFIE